MSEPIPLLTFVKLGESVAVVSNPQPFHADAVSTEVRNLLDRLSACGLTRTRSAAESLSKWQLSYNLASGLINASQQQNIKATMVVVNQSIHDETVSKHIAEIDLAAAPSRLRQIESTLSLTTSQVYLKDETVRCLERGAYRAGIVMGWCLAYDIIRHWVYSDSARLATFNTELAKYTKGKSGARQYSDIVHYDDFFRSKSPGEFRVVDICEAANIIDGRIARRLINNLDTRNDHAHATAMQPSLQQACAYVETLIDIITNPPFHQPPPPT